MELSAHPKEAEMGLNVPKKITYHTTEKLLWLDTKLVEVHRGAHGIYICDLEGPFKHCRKFAPSNIESMDRIGVAHFLPPFYVQENFFQFDFFY